MNDSHFNCNEPNSTVNEKKCMSPIMDGRCLTKVKQLLHFRRTSESVSFKDYNFVLQNIKREMVDFS